MTMTGYNKKQSGIALIIGLIILLLLTIIMVTALRVTSLEEKMAGNLRNQNIAFQAAETALREAEGFIQLEGKLIDWDRGGALDDPNPFDPLYLSGGPFQNTTGVCDDGLCSTTTPLQSSDMAAAIAAGYTKTAATGIATISAEPEYIIELIGIQPDNTDSGRLYATFRITASARGGDSNSLVQLQSTYRLHAYSFVL